MQILSKLSQVVILSIATIFVVGCGGGESNSSSDTFAQNIQGKWYPNKTNKGCFPNSKLKILMDVDEDTMIVHHKIYSKNGCKDADLIKIMDRVFSYAIGAKTHGKDGKEAYEIDISETNNSNDYTMFRLIDNKLFTAKKDGNRDGTTKNKRKNMFEDDRFFIKFTN